MPKIVRPFDSPIYVTRPLLPDLEKVNDKLQEIWACAWLTNNGPQQAALEKALLQELKVPYLSLFNNGTTALLVACQALGLSGEVLTTPFTFCATAHVLAWSHIQPIFCDIEPGTLNLDANQIEPLLTPQTTAILGVHVFGTPCDVGKIREVANRHGLKVVYDAAHAFGVEVDHAGIGGYGDASMFSFHATKTFHTAEGGALTCQDQGLKEKIDLLKNFGIKNEEEVVLPGLNGKMNEIQAALGLLNLQRFEAEVNQRRRLTEAYDQCLKDVDGISHIPVPPGVKSNYQYYPIRIDAERFGCSRDAVYERFHQFNVFPRKYFFPLCSDYPCYRPLPSAEPSRLPVAQKAAREILCLPLYGGLSLDDVERICDILRSFA